jgi:hypothetical protein
MVNTTYAIRQWRAESWRGKYWMVVDAERGQIIADKIISEDTARLIAAAPELLEAAKAAAALIRGSGFAENTKALIALHGAIAKVENGR